MSGGYGFTLAVCAEMVFRDRPVCERVRRIHDLGFAVEIWDWTTNGWVFSSMKPVLSSRPLDLASAIRSERMAARGPVRGCLSRSSTPARNG